MPFPVAAAVAAGAGLLGSYISSRQSGKNLSDEIAYSKEAAELQHKNNIELWRMQADRDRENWHMANLYNSPAQQMARLKEAGLNPRLIYGSSGSTGGMATAMKSGSPNSYKYNVPDFSQRRAFDVTDGINAYVDLEMKQAQIDAIEQQTSLAQQREANEAVENAIKVAEAESASPYYRHRSTKMRRESNLKYQQMQLGAHSMEVASEKLEQAKLDTAIAGQRLELTREQVVGQKIKNDYERAGISPNSPYQARLLYNQLKKSGMDQDQIAVTLLTAGVGAEALKTLLPAGIIGKALGKMKLGKSKTKYNSTQGWKAFESRHYE